MKKLLVVFIATLFLGCDDGDFDIPSFEFEDTVMSCGTYLLYIKNSSSTETLVIGLSESDLPDSEGTTELQISSERGINYRIYNNAIGADYFCKAIPPTEPNVVKELNAESGTIIFTTTSKSSGFDYEITISNLSFQDEKERIFFESFYFGIFSN